jgi:serine phosphatase RsbU (regulator of sigma subunit)
MAAHKHRVALALQQALLASTPVTYPGIDIAACYSTGSEALEVGGDWYDSFPLADGRIVITVGDIVGHYLRTAAAMGRLRVGLAALAMNCAGPGELVAKLEEFARGGDGTERYWEDETAP